MNIFEFMQNFDTSDKILNFLLRENILYCEITCYCGSLMKLTYESNRYRYIFRCVTEVCRRKRSCYYGTIFNNATLPFPKIMMFLFLWLKKVSVMKIVDITGISHKTVMGYIKKIESLIFCSLDEEDCVIGGPGIEVKIWKKKI
jgi:hypothetical protein